LTVNPQLLIFSINGSRLLYSQQPNTADKTTSTTKNKHHTKENNALKKHFEKERTK
jgi:hypothetical protein